MPNANSPVWPGPSLLVPLTVDVLLMGDPDASTKFADTHTNYYNLWKFQTPDAAEPFSTATPPATGAHLMWSLPFSLRQGEQVQEGDDAGELDFPLVPNRWVVTRIDYSQSPPALTAWVLQSDALNTLTSSQQTGQFPNPSGASPPVMVIGQSVPLASWAGPAGPATPFLQAVGPGDISWAAEFSNVGNVFTFYDPLFTGAAQLTYAVAGWYADPASDPLQPLPVTTGDVWLAQLEQSWNWTIGDTEQDITDAEDAWIAWAASRGLTGTADPSLAPQLLAAIQAWQTWQAANGLPSPPPTIDLPQAMVCHGMVATVEWQGSIVGYKSGAPGQGATLASVAVRNTATEAIAAYLAADVVKQYGGDQETKDTVERALEAFQQGLLFDLATDPIGTEYKLQQARFGSVAGGTEWIVVRPDDQGDTPAYGGQQTIPLNDAQTLKLSELNAAQRTLDDIGFQLATQRTELFALWYKQKVLGSRGDPSTQQLVTAATTAMKSAITASMAAQTTQQSLVASDQAELVALLGSEYVLRQVDLPPYFGPNDPVLMVGGAEIDPKLSPPGVYDDTVALFTRFTGQTITGITVQAQWGTATLGATELLGAGGVTLPTGMPVPKETADLWVETLLLDTGASPLLAALYFAAVGVENPSSDDLTAVATQIATQQTTVWNDPTTLGVTTQALQTESGLVGVLPSIVGVEFRQGQPWTPVFMDWSVSWFPTSFDPAGALQGWMLGEIDYEWLPPFNVLQLQDPIPLQGRTVVNPKIAQDIAAQFATFQSDPNYKSLPQYLLDDLQHVADVAGDLDLLTQSLSGFTFQLVTLLTSMNLEPTDTTIAALLDGAPVSYRPVTGNVGSEAPGTYFPLRSGHLQILDVWVVDAFGQIMRGKDPRLGTNPLPQPCRAESVTTPDPVGEPGTNDSYVQLPPRVSQAARAELRFLQADDDEVFSNSSDLTSPLCGWVMANHLDDSLMVFDAYGNALGSILPVQRDASGSSTGLLWEAVPGSDAALGAAPVLVSAATPDDLPNEHLTRFVNALMARGATSSGALTELLDAIDSSLWAIDPFATGTGNLAVLLGRPLAVVRAQVAVELMGYAAYDQAWSATGQYYATPSGQYAPVNPPFQSVPFTVRVGDLGYTQNGVLGYFAANDYDTFYAVYGNEGQTAGLRQALRAHPSEIREALALGLGASPPSESSYVERGHLVQLETNGTAMPLTVLVDPGGVVPIVAGSQPAVSVALAPGPVSQALANMQANFRVGPVLVDPASVSMPLPADITGNWAYVARTDVTTWAAPQALETQPPTAQLADTPPTLAEGWLTLSGAMGSTTSPA